MKKILSIILILVLAPITLTLAVSHMAFNYLLLILIRLENKMQSYVNAAENKIRELEEERLALREKVNLLENKLSRAVDCSDALSAAILDIRGLVTTDHETKADFIESVKKILDSNAYLGVSRLHDRIKQLEKEKEITDEQVENIIDQCDGFLKWGAGDGGKQTIKQKIRSIIQESNK